VRYASTFLVERLLLLLDNFSELKLRACSVAPFSFPFLTTLTVKRCTRGRR
jgi:hypothetical protein